MKKVSWCARVFVCLTLMASLARADDFNKAGRTAFQFVKIGIGARQVALGDASVAYVRDVNSMFWNPAGISGIESIQTSFSYASWFAGMNYMSGAAGIRWPDVGVVSVGVSTLRYGDIAEALAVGTNSDTRTGQFFTGSDLQAAVAFSHDFSDALSIGVSAKYLSEKLFNYSTGVMAFDVGTYYNTGYNGIRFAMSFQNFGKSVKFISLTDNDEGYDIPLVYRIGAAVDLVRPSGGFLTLGADHSLSVCVETLNSNDYGERWHMGAEYTFNNLVSLRAGYRLNYDDGNLSLGAGIHQKLESMDISVDYSYTSYQYLESPHRVTLSLTF